MSMTRRDFLAISSALRAARIQIEQRADLIPEFHAPSARLVLDDSTHKICDAIAAKTPAGVFDKRRFLTDCGLTAEG